MSTVDGVARPKEWPEIVMWWRDYVEEFPWWDVDDEGYYRVSAYHIIRHCEGVEEVMLVEHNRQVAVSCVSFMQMAIGNNWRRPVGSHPCPQRMAEKINRLALKRLQKEASRVPPLQRCVVGPGARYMRSNVYFGGRVEEILLNAHVRTAGDLAMMTEAQLMRLRGFGKTALRDTKYTLEELGLSLGMPGAPGPRELLDAALVGSS